MGRFLPGAFCFRGLTFLGESLENGVASLSPVRIYRSGFLLLEKQCMSGTFPEACVPGLALIIPPQRMQL